MGDSDAKIEQSIGVMYGMPAKNDSWQVKNPSIDAANILRKSFLSTFSLGINNDINQNKPPAPMALRQKMVSGESKCPLVKSLHTIMLKPKMAYAAKQAKCPKIDKLFFIIDGLKYRLQN